jgi:hypothetical protein
MHAGRVSRGLSHKTELPGLALPLMMISTLDFVDQPAIFMRLSHYVVHANSVNVACFHRAPVSSHGVSGWWRFLFMELSPASSKTPEKTKNRLDDVRKTSLPLHSEKMCRTSKGKEDTIGPRWL